MDKPAEEVKPVVASDWLKVGSIVVGTATKWKDKYDGVKCKVVDLLSKHVKVLINDTNEVHKYTYQCVRPLSPQPGAAAGSADAAASSAAGAAAAVGATATPDPAAGAAAAPDSAAGALAAPDPAAGATAAVGQPQAAIGQPQAATVQDLAMDVAELWNEF